MYCIIKNPIYDGGGVYDLYSRAMKFSLIRDTQTNFICYNYDIPYQGGFYTMKTTSMPNKNIYVNNNDDAKGMIGVILNFLVLFMPMTLAKRVVSIILIAAGLPVSRIVELTGLTDRSIESFGRTVRDGNTASLLELKEGRGRISKTVDIEGQILAELEKGNYHTRQQIADMIKEKFHISMSVSAVGRFLKKRHSKTQKRLSARQSEYGETAGIL